MKEEDVLDHGDATPEDTVDLEHDLDSLAFEPYLIKTMRLLVGVNMWGHEVYYMRQADEEGKALVPRLPAAAKSLTKNPSEYEFTRLSDRLSASPKAPNSAMGLASASGSVVRKRKRVGSSVFTDSEPSEYENGTGAGPSLASQSTDSHPSALVASKPGKTISKSTALPIQLSHSSLGQEPNRDNRKLKKLKMSMSEPRSR